MPLSLRGYRYFPGLLTRSAKQEYVGSGPALNQNFMLAKVEERPNDLTLTLCKFKPKGPFDFWQTKFSFFTLWRLFRKTFSDPIFNVLGFFVKERSFPCLRGNFFVIAWSCETAYLVSITISRLFKLPLNSLQQLLAHIVEAR